MGAEKAVVEKQIAALKELHRGLDLWAASRIGKLLVPTMATSTEKMWLVWRVSICMTYRLFLMNTTNMDRSLFAGLDSRTVLEHVT